jgi:hypothetical protein
VSKWLIGCAGLACTQGGLGESLSTAQTRSGCRPARPGDDRQTGNAWRGENRADRFRWFGHGILGRFESALERPLSPIERRAPIRPQGLSHGGIVNRLEFWNSEVGESPRSGTGERLASRVPPRSDAPRGHHDQTGTNGGHECRPHSQACERPTTNSLGAVLSFRLGVGSERVK